MATQETTEKDETLSDATDREKETGIEKSEVKKIINLAPYKITDHGQIAKFWEKIRICNTHNDYPKIESFHHSINSVKFAWSEWFRVAMRALDKPEFKGLISVEAMAFPVLYCKDSTEAHRRKYIENLIQDGESNDLIPLIDSRNGIYGDPWTDGKFPVDLTDPKDPKSYSGHSRVLPESCIWVKCPECKGKGGTDKKMEAGYQKLSINCPLCGGSGMTGIKICKECHGKGRRVISQKQYVNEFVKCKKCGGSGKVRSVLEAFEILKSSRSESFAFVAVPDGTIPSCVWEDHNRSEDTPCAWETVTRIEEPNGRISLSNVKLPDFGSASEKIKKELIRIHEKLDDPSSHFLAENIEIGCSPRYVRFNLKFFVNVNRDWGLPDFEERSLKIRKTGCAPKGYFTPSRKEVANMIVWLDQLTGETWGASRNIWEEIKIMDPLERNREAEFSGYCWGFSELLSVMGKSTGVPRLAISKNPQKDKTKGAKKSKTRGSDVSTSSKKRWKFVVLGLLFGYLGIHLAYAKRWFLFLLLWAAFVTGGVMSGGSGESEKPTADAEVVEVAKSDESPKKESGSPLGGIGFAVWGLLWIGGTLFIKKDGKGNRM